MWCCVQDGVAKSIYTERISKNPTDKNSSTHVENKSEIEGGMKLPFHTHIPCKRHKAQRYKSLRQSGLLWLFRWHKVN